MAEDLSRWLSGIETVARPLSYVEKYKRWYRKNRTLARLWTTVAGFLAMFFVFISIDYGRMRITYDDQSEKLVKAEDDQLEVQRNLAINEFERGRNLCESGELNQGLLWLANSLEKISPELSDLEKPIRSYISSWLPHIHQIRWIFPHKDPVNTVSISPDNKLLIVGTGSLDILFSPDGFLENMKPPAKGEVQFWDLETGELIPESITHDSSVTKVAISPDGKIAISASLDRSLKIFDLKKGKEVHAPLVHPHAIIGAAFNHDGSLLATGCLDGNLRIWNTNTWQQVGQSMKHDLRYPSEGIHSAVNPQPLLNEMAFTPDDSHLLVNARRMDYPFVAIWDLSNYKQVEYPEYFKISQVTSFTPDSESLISNIEKDILLVKNWKTPKKRGTLINEVINILDVAVNRKTKTIAIGGLEQSAWVYDLEYSAQNGQLLKHNDSIDVVEISMDGEIIITGGKDKYVKVWNTAIEKSWGKSIIHNGGAGVKLFPDGKKILTSDSNNLHVKDQPRNSPGARVRIWDIQSMKMIKGPFLEDGMMNGIDITANGELYARGNWFTVRLRNIENGKLIHQLNHPGRVNTAVWANGDQNLITGCGDGKIRFWDVKSGKLLGEPISHDKGVSSLSISPDKKYLLSICGDGTANFWNLSDRTRISEPILHPKDVQCATFHPNGSYIATGCKDGSVYFWSVPDGKPVKTPIYNYDPKIGICSLKFTPDGTQIMIGGNMKGIQFWDLKSMLPATRLMMDGSWLRMADLSDDGNYLVSSIYSSRGKGIEVQVRNVAPQIKGTPAEVKKMIERKIGMNLKKDGEIKILSPDEWRATKEKLDNVGGLKVSK
jgi:WD40 repeat protein